MDVILTAFILVCLLGVISAIKGIRQHRNRARENQKKIEEFEREHPVGRKKDERE